MKIPSRTVYTRKRAFKFFLALLPIMATAVLASCSPKASGNKSEIIIRDYPEFTTEDESNTETKFSSVSEYLASIGITVEDDSAADNEHGSEGVSSADIGSSSEDISSIGIVYDTEPASSPLDSSVSPSDAASSPDASSTETGTAESEAKDFKVYFIEVGQGDSSLIICDGHSMLIDGGQASKSDKVYEFLSSRNVTHLDYIVASYLDEGHVGGLSGALSCATVGKVLSPVSSSDEEPVQAFLKALADRNVDITVPSAGDIFSLGSATITVLGPVKQGNNANDNSLVLRIVHGENSILFAGDAEQAEENDILNSGADVKSTILKVGNHGSSTSTSSEWLSAVNPSVAVIFCGSDNGYGHPSATVLGNLKNSGIKVYRTDLQGFLKVTEENGRFSYRIARNASIDVFNNDAEDKT